MADGDYREGTLVLSTNSGRYALDDPVFGRDLTAGDAVIVQVGDTWVHGSIAHSSAKSSRGVYAAERATHAGIALVQAIISSVKSACWGCALACVYECTSNFSSSRRVTL